MRTTKCDRCKGESNLKEVFGLRCDKKHSQQGSYNKYRVVRKVRWFGWRTFADSLDYVSSWITGKIEIDICDRCQESFNMWLDDPNYEENIVKGVLENPEESMEIIKKS